METRRQLLKAIGVSGVALPLSGCTTSGDSGANETTTTAEPTTETTTTEAEPETVTVAVGPEKRLRYEPETVEISVGDTVEWTFESPGHNVTTKSGASPKCKVPDGAEEFASYEGKNHFSINEVGTTYSYTFEVTGEYVYVCTPHAGQGMVGTVFVNE